MESAKSGKENKQQIIRPGHGILAKKKATISMMQSSDSDDDEEDEWEAVEPVHSKQEKIKKEKIVEVNLEGKAAEKFKAKLMNPLEISSKKEEEERLKWEHCMRLEMERKQRELQEDLHRIHFLAFIAHLRFLTNTLVKHRQLLIEKMEPILGFSTLPTSTIEMGKLLREVFRANFSNRICINEKFPLSWYKDDKALIEHLCSLIERKGFSTDREIALLFFAYCAFLLELPTRICIAFNPMPRLMKLPKYLAERKPEKPKATRNTATKTNKKSKMDEIKKNLKRQMPTRSAAKRQKLEVENDEEKDENITSTDEDEHEISSEEEESSEEDEKRKRKSSTRGKKRKRSTKQNVKRNGKEVVNDGNNEIELETEPSKPEQNSGRVYWNEYWDEQEQRWISVDAFHNSVDVPIKIDDKILYVLAIDNDFGVREIGGKYLTNFLALETRKLRTDPEWLKQTLYPYLRVTNTTRQEREDNAILELLKAKPFPQKLAEYKNHPLYALKKDLLKFEAIYPEDQVPLGTISVGRTGEHEIFPRSAVHKLEGSLNWIKESRSIKEGEKPYKVVKARPKTNIPKEKRTPLTLDLYGYWQTEPYVPPEVVDGKIPRNEFGNIYMYKKEMLPNGCVHLQLNGIFNIARRLNLEAVPAVVGWEFSGGINHPILDGCVVLKNDEEMLRSAWLEMTRNKAANEAKKNSERVWKNWRRLVRSKLLLEKMRNRFK